MGLRAVAGLNERACSPAVTVVEGLVRSRPEAVAEAMKGVIHATADNDVAARAGRLLRRIRPKR